MIYTVIILIGFSLFIMLKNPKKLHNWLLFCLILITAIRITAMVLFVAKFGDYQRSDYPLFQLDYTVSLQVFTFRYGPYDISTLGYILEGMFLL